MSLAKTIEMNLMGAFVYEDRQRYVGLAHEKVLKSTLSSKSLAYVYHSDNLLLVECNCCFH